MEVELRAELGGRGAMETSLRHGDFFFITYDP